jgi:two-component system cell cycle response regulator
MARILVIEDNPTNLELMSYLLKAFGHEVLTAMDGDEGLQSVRRTSPDLVICDVQLPRVGGFEVAVQLKANPALRSIPLIAVTALAMVGDRDKLLAGGFDGYISKPIDPEKFVPEVEKFLRSSPTTPKNIETESSFRHANPNGVSILVVDNSPVNLSLAQSTLEPFGYQVVIAHSVIEGLEAARKNRPDLILSDVHMPHESGFDFIRDVKADPQLRDVPFVFISSTVWGDSDQNTGLALGAAKFIMRPVDPADLIREIEECLKLL